VLVLQPSCANSAVTCTTTWLLMQVKAANQLAAAEGFKPEDVMFVVGDANAPSLPDQSFDLVLSVESAVYMPDKGWVAGSQHTAASQHKVVTLLACMGSSASCF